MQQPTNPQPQEIVVAHDLKEITALLVKHHGLHEGFYDLMLEFQIGVGAAGPDPSSVIPSAMVGVKRIGLMKTIVLGTTTVNAAEVNPPVQPKKTVAKKVSAK